MTRVDAHPLVFLIGLRAIEEHHDLEMSKHTKHDILVEGKAGGYEIFLYSQSRQQDPFLIFSLLVNHVIAQELVSLACKDFQARWKSLDEPHVMHIPVEVFNELVDVCGGTRFIMESDIAVLGVSQEFGVPFSNLHLDF